MTLSPSAGPTSQMCDILLRGLRQGFLDYSGLSGLAGARWPWAVPDLPCLLVFEADPFIRPEDGGTACTDQARFEVAFITGPPAKDGLSELHAHWSDFIVQPWAMTDLVKDPLFPSVAVPVLEQVGGPRAVDMFGHLWVASISDVRAELHIDPRKGP